MVMLLLDSSRVYTAMIHNFVCDCKSIINIVCSHCELPVLHDAHMLLVSIGMDSITIHALSEIISITPSFHYYYEGGHIKNLGGYLLDYMIMYLRLIELSIV